MVFGWLTSKFGANAAATRAVARLTNATAKYGNSNTRKKARNASNAVERQTTLLKDVMTENEETLAETKKRCVASVKQAQDALNLSRANYNKVKDTVLSKIGRFATYGVANRSKLVNVQQARQHTAVINSYSKLKASQDKADAAAKAAEEAAEKTKAKLKAAEDARAAEATKRAAAAAAAARAIKEGATTITAAAAPSPSAPSPSAPSPSAPGNNKANKLKLRPNNNNARKTKRNKILGKYENSVNGSVNYNRVSNADLEEIMSLSSKEEDIYQRVVTALRKRMPMIENNPASPAAGGGRTRRR